MAPVLLILWRILIVQAIDVFYGSCMRKSLNISLFKNSLTFSMKICKTHIIFHNLPVIYSRSWSLMSFFPLIALLTFSTA